MLASASSRQRLREQREAELLRLLRVPVHARRRRSVRPQLPLVVVARLAAKQIRAHDGRAGPFGPAACPDPVLGADDRVGPLLDLREDLRQIHPDHADAEDDQAAEEPDRHHDRRPSRHADPPVEAACRAATTAATTDSAITAIADLEDVDQGPVAERRDGVGEHRQPLPGRVGRVRPAAFLNRQSAAARTR